MPGRDQHHESQAKTARTEFVVAIQKAWPNVRARVSFPGEKMPRSLKKAVGAAAASGCARVRVLEYHRPAVLAVTRGTMVSALSHEERETQAPRAPVNYKRAESSITGAGPRTPRELVLRNVLTHDLPVSRTTSGRCVGPHLDQWWWAAGRALSGSWVRADCSFWASTMDITIWCHAIDTFCTSFLTASSFSWPYYA